MLLLLFVGGGEPSAISFAIFENATITAFADVATVTGPADVGQVTGEF